MLTEQTQKLNAAPVMIDVSALLPLIAQARNAALEIEHRRTQWEALPKEKRDKRMNQFIAQDEVLTNDYEGAARLAMDKLVELLPGDYQ